MSGENFDQYLFQQRNERQKVKLDYDEVKKQISNTQGPLLAKIFESVTENCKLENCEDSDADEDDHLCENSVGLSDDEDFTIRQKK